MRSVIKKNRVEVGAPAKAARPMPAEPVEPAPAVRLVRADGVVHALEVRCHCCGEVTVVELEYGA